MAMLLTLPASLAFAPASAHAELVRPRSRWLTWCERTLTAAGLLPQKTLAEVHEPTVSLVPQGNELLIQSPWQDRPVLYKRTNRDLFNVVDEGLLPKEFFRVDELRGLKVLDEGCGGGRLVEDLRRLEIDIVGLDAWLTKYQKRKPYFIRASMDDTGLPSGEIDVIFAIQSGFTYLLNEGGAGFESILAEAHRILKPGGRLIISPLHPRRVTAASLLMHGAHPESDFGPVFMGRLEGKWRIRSAPDASWFADDDLRHEGKTPFYWLELEKVN